MNRIRTYIETAKDGALDIARLAYPRLDRFVDVILVSVPRTATAPFVHVRTDEDGGPITVYRDKEGDDYHFHPGPVLSQGSSILLKEENGTRLLSLRRIGYMMEIESLTLVEPIVPGAPNTDRISVNTVMLDKGRIVEPPNAWGVRIRMTRVPHHHPDPQHRLVP